MTRKKLPKNVFPFEKRPARTLVPAGPRGLLPTAAALFALLAGCGRAVEPIREDPVGNTPKPKTAATPDPIEEPKAPAVVPPPMPTPLSTPLKAGGGVPTDVSNPYEGPLHPPPPKPIAAPPATKPPIKPHPHPPHLDGDMAATRPIDVGNVKIDRPVHA